MPVIVLELTNCAVVALAVGFSRNLRLTVVSSLSWGTSHGLPYCVHEATGRFAFVGQGEMEECSSEDGRSKGEGKGSYHVLRRSASAFVQIDTEEVLELELVGETTRVFKPCISERVASLTRKSRVESILGCRLRDVKVPGHCVNRRGTLASAHELQCSASYRTPIHEQGK